MLNRLKGRVLYDGNLPIFIPRKQEDKGSSVLLFYRMYFTCHKEGYTESRKRQLSDLQFWWKSKTTLIYKKIPHALCGDLDWRSVSG
jgi:hypothetical protein